MITATFPPDACGVGDYTFQLCQALQRLGVQVDVVTSRRPGPPAPPPGSIISSVRRITGRWNARSLIPLLRQIRSGGYRCVHIQYSPNFYGLLSFAIHLLPWVLMGFGGRTVVTFHEIYAPKLGGFANRFFAVYDHIKDTVLLLGSAAAILTVPSRVDRLGRRFSRLRSRLYAIPVGTGVRVEEDAPDARTTARADFGVQPEEWLIGSFGSMHVDRRYDTLFRVVRRLLDRGCRLRVVLIGAYDAKHPYYRYLKKCIADLDLEPYIIWTGFGPEAQVSRWLGMLDLYVMTDLRGASGRKSSLITALAHGLPVISTRGTDTTPEFVDGENILLVDPDDEDAFFRHIDRLLSDPSERNRMRTGARRLFVAHYAWESIAQQTLEVYHTHGSGAER
jgi:glycosyltransferase involved in cell wall biosynthesis